MDSAASHVRNIQCIKKTGANFDNKRHAVVNGAVPHYLQHMRRWAKGVWGKPVESPYVQADIQYPVFRDTKKVP